MLAGLVGRAWADGLAKDSDDELIGIMRAWRRLTAWAQAGELAAVTELDRRRNAQVAAGADPHLAEHVADELAPPLTLTHRAAENLLDFAIALQRLPLTRAALAAGEIDGPKAHVITDELTGVDGLLAAAVEAVVIGRAPRMTTGQLRTATHRAVLAADRRISAHARELKANGAQGTMDQLRAKVYTALLTGQSAEALLESLSIPLLAGVPPASGETAGAGAADGEPARSAPAAGAGASPSLSRDPAAEFVRRWSGGGIGGSVNLTMPMSTWLGASEAPATYLDSVPSPPATPARSPRSSRPGQGPDGASP